MQLVRALRHSFVIACLAGSAALRAAPADDARAALASGIEDVAAQLRGHPAQADQVAILDQAADKYFAFAATARLAVGPAWRDFTADQRSKITSLFSRLVVRTYANRIGGDNPPEIAYGAAVELKPGRIEIPTTVKMKTDGQTYSVVYRLELDPANAAAGWRVYDVIAEGVSLISNYRAQFDPIVKKSGAAGLIAAIEAKVAESAAAPAP